MFQFKQFVIRQDRTAMKVCTDACVLGAWADVGTGARLLDIGTGTGLLALMAAQRAPHAHVDAVEVDEAAAQQAWENVANSPFARQITIHQTAIQDFLFPAPDPALRYDHILTNPPFYTNSLRSPDRAVNRALHADELPFSDLLAAVGRLLAPAGTWWLLLPPPEMNRLTQQAAHVPKPLFPVRQLYLRHHAHKPIVRHLTAFRFGNPASAEQAAPSSPTVETLDIYEPDGQPGRPTYTAAFRALLQPYYLIF